VERVSLSLSLCLSFCLTAILQLIRKVGGSHAHSPGNKIHMQLSVKSSHANYNNFRNRNRCEICILSMCVCVSNAATKSRGREREGDNAAYGDKRCRCHCLCIICTIVAKKMRAAQLQIQDAKVTQLQLLSQLCTQDSIVSRLLLLLLLLLPYPKFQQFTHTRIYKYIYIGSHFWTFVMPIMK